ncbi:MAG: carboxypeptidase-like regulatory domain-containing protein [Thermoguttaceae bacterium]
MVKTRRDIMFRYACVALPCLLLLLASGCGKRYPGKEKLYPTMITVLESGQPIDGAVVILMRQSGENLVLSGLTDKSGKARIAVESEWPGAPEGKFQVRISKDPPFTPDLTPEEVAKLAPNEYSAYESQMVAKRLSLKPVIDPELSSDKSPFFIDIVSGKNEKTFDIIADVK